MSDNSFLNKITRHSDGLVGIGIVVILMVLLVPMPEPIIDVLLAINIMLAFVILLAPIYLLRPSDFSAFPGVLLVVTLYRLSLNVATTRSILSRGSAGAIIQTFVEFIIRGDVIVGLIIFIIIFIINFMVITKGSVRIAEVAARFTLDAMPGKQMAIDADLNNGVIDETEARDRREQIRAEADFYGAMDGASKFVKGDAVAGIIITTINIIGGFAIGMMKGGIGWQDVLRKYTLLTVGDGLVAQIPALLISTAAGIIVTRSGSKASMGKEIVGQLTQEPKALYVSGVVIALFTFIVPSRWYLFMGLGGGLIAVAYLMTQGTKDAATRKAKAEMVSQEMLQSEEKPEDIADYLQVDSLELEIGYSLISLIDEKQNGDLLDRITSLRKQIALEVGILVPPIRIRDNISLVPNQYLIKIRGEEITRGECLVNHYLALDSGNVDTPIKGIATTEPAFGLPALWITEDKREIAEMHGYTIIEAAAMIATHLSEIVKTNADKIITRQDVQKLLDNVKKENEAVVKEILDSNVLTLGNIEAVLKNLLHEAVPIRDMITILETLADYARLTQDTETLTEYVRFALARTIAKRYLAADGSVRGIAFGAEIEKEITEVVQKIKNRDYNASLSPAILGVIYNDLKEAAAQMTAEGDVPLLLISPLVRSYTKKLVETALPTLAVLSYSEIPTEIPIDIRITINKSTD